MLEGVFHDVLIGLGLGVFDFADGAVDVGLGHHVADGGCDLAGVGRADYSGHEIRNKCGAINIFKKLSSLPSQNPYRYIESF